MTRDTPMTRRAKILIAAAIAAVVLLVPLVGGFVWYQMQLGGSGSGDEVTFDLQRGWTHHDIADALDDAGVVSSSLATRIYIRVNSSGPFLAGIYTLRENMGVRDAIAALERGPEYEYEELRLPPGFTVLQIAQRVGALEGRDEATFLALMESGTVRSKYQPDGVNSLEGLTWPDTYFVAGHESDEELLRRLVERFDAEAEAAGIESAGDTGLTPYEAVIVASLIQTEAGVASDRPQVSAVVRNRLEIGMPLQIDSTVVYARGGGDGIVTFDDLEIDSPYNTYLITGLPPTPISTVTTESLEAALAPADVPYLYYVLIDESGEHAFAETYEEHLANVARARELGLL